MTTARRTITTPAAAPPTGAQPRVIVVHSATATVTSEALQFIEKNGDLYCFQIGDNITPSSYGDPEVLCFDSSYSQKYTPMRGGAQNAWYRIQGVTQSSSYIFFGGGTSTALQLYKINNDLTVASSNAVFMTEARDMCYDAVNSRVGVVGQAGNILTINDTTLAIVAEKTITGTVDGFTLSNVRASTIAADGSGNWFVGWYGVADGKGVYGVMRLDSNLGVTHTYCYTDTQTGLYPVCVSYDATSSRVMMRCRGRYSIYGSHLILLNGANLSYINGVKLRDSYNHEICKSVRIGSEYFTLLRDGSNCWLAKFDLSLTKQQEIYATMSSVTMQRYALAEYDGLIGFCVRANAGLGGSSQDGIYIMLDTDLHQYAGKTATCMPNLSFTQASNVNTATNFTTSTAAITLNNTSQATGGTNTPINAALPTTDCEIS